MFGTEDVRADSSKSERSWLSRWSLAAVVLLVGVGLSATASAEDLKIGYVDLHKALNSVEEGKEAKKKLKKDYDDKQKKLNEKQKEVKKLKEDLESQSMALSKEAKIKKQRELQSKMQELQKMYMGLQRNLSQKEAEATKEIFDKMREVVEEIAEDEGYDLVLEKRKSSVLFAKDGMNLTEELIERYQKKH